MEDAGPVECGVALGQDERLNVNGKSNAGLEETIDGIVRWLSTVSAAEPARFDLAPFDRCKTTAVVARDARSRPIIERPVRFGRPGLFGIITELEGAEGATTVVCFNTANSRRIGPSRLWVELAREWAGFGLRTLRVDMSGIGDSGTHPGQTRDIFYPVEAPARHRGRGEIRVTPRHLTPGPGRLVLGCVSRRARWTVARRARCLRHQPGLRCSPAPSPVTSAAPTPTTTTTTTTATTTRSQPSVSPRRWVARLAGHERSKAVLAALPDGAWWVFNRLGVRRSPVESLRRLVDDGSDVMIIVGPDEAADIKRGAAHALRKLSRSDRFQFVVIDDLDHSMLGVHDERRVGDLVYRHVRDRFGQSDDAGDAADDGLGRGLDDPLVKARRR